MAAIELLDEFGNLRVIDETEAPAALQAGWRPETSQETQARLEAVKYGTLGEQATGLTEQALSGATLGLSDVALSEFGGDPYREAAAARARQLGAAGTAAKVAGAIAPLLLSGGESAPATLGEIGGAGVRLVGAPVRGAAALGRAGEVATGGALRGLGMTGESALGAGILRGTELGVGGALEGGAYGAGQALSESALAPGGNYDHLAEKMFAGAEEGAKFGFLTGGALGLVGGAGSRAITRGAEKLVGPGGLKNLLQRTSDEATVRAVGALTPKDAAVMGETGISRMANEVKNTVLDDGTRLFTPGASKEQIAERLDRAVPETGTKIGALRKDLSSAIEASGRHDLRPDLGDFFKAVDGMVAAAESGPAALLKRAERARNEVAGLRKAWLGEAGAESRMSWQEFNKSRLPALFREHGHDAHKLVAEEWRAYKAGAGAATPAIGTGRVTLEEAAAYRQKLDNILFPKKAGGGIQVAPKNAAELEQVRGLLEQAVESSIERSVKELMPARAGEYQALKSRYSALKNAQKLSEREASREIARNRLSPIETLSSVGGAIASVASGNVLPLVAGSALSGARKLWRSRGESVLAILADRAARAEGAGKGAVKGYLARLADARRGAVGEAAGKEVEQKGRVARVLKQKETETAQRAYARRMTQLVNFTPDKMQGFNDLASSAPQTAAAAAALMTRARQYLLQTAPTSALEADPLQPQLKKPNPDPVMLEKWARRLEAAQDPSGTLKRGLSTGSLTREHVETMKAIYPNWFEARRDELRDELLTMKERVPYMERVKLGVLFELPTDKSLEPRNLARTQSMYAQMAAQQPTPQAPKQPDNSQTIAGRVASESQRLEANIPPM